jgi:CheY-specific phosphatase CheX
MQTINATDIQEVVTTHLLRLLDTMFSTKAAPLGQSVPQPEPERVSGSVGFGGEAVAGVVYLHLPARFAALLAACMLGADPKSLSEAEVNDVVGELANILSGGLKSWLCDASFSCAASTPVVIRGSSFAIEPPPGVERLCLEFSCGVNRFWVEVHFKFQ